MLQKVRTNSKSGFPTEESRPLRSCSRSRRPGAYRSFLCDFASLQYALRPQRGVYSTALMPFAHVCPPTLSARVITFPHRPLPSASVCSRAQRDRFSIASCGYGWKRTFKHKSILYMFWYLGALYTLVLSAVVRDGAEKAPFALAFILRSLVQ